MNLYMKAENKIIFDKYFYRLFRLWNVIFLQILKWHYATFKINSMYKVESESFCGICYRGIYFQLQYCFNKNVNRRTDFDAFYLQKIKKSGTVILHFDNFYYLILADRLVIYMPFVIIHVYGNLLKYKSSYSSHF